MTSEPDGRVLGPLDEEDLKLSDPDLGIRLLDLCVVSVAVENDQVESLGDPEFTQAVIDLILRTEAEAAKNSTVEKALHKAAAKEFETAGRLLREHISNGARTIAITNIAISERAKRIKGPKAGGKKRAAQQREKSAERNSRMAVRYRELESAGLKKHEIIGTLSSEEGLAKSTTRRIVNKTRVS